MTAILFDLDGTLADTALDLGYALNLQLQRHGKPALDDAIIRPIASHGSRGLLALGFGLTPQDSQFNAMRDEYLNLYDQVFTRSPKLFEGMQELLAGLEQRQIAWGIVTNKPRRFTQRLIESLGLSQRAACVVSGDDAARPKPAPDTLLLACRLAKIKPEECIYVGDAARDIEAGKAAGMKTLVALFGYLGAHDVPENWGADGMIKTPAELLQFI